MRFSAIFLALFLLVSQYIDHVNGLISPKKLRHHAIPRGGADTSRILQSTSTNDNSPQDFTAEASALFGNLRIPAALFAGASTASAFALPLLDGVDGLKVGMVKRIYSLLMVMSLSSQVVAVIVSTLSVMALSTGCKKCNDNSSPTLPPTSLQDFLQQNYELEWLCTRLHFMGGVLLFSLGIGLRAWITVSCPVFGKTALGVIISSTLLCLSFWRDLDTGANSLQSLAALPFQYYKAAWKKSKTNKLFAVTLIFWATTLSYMLVNLPHVAQYLIRSSAK